MCTADSGNIFERETYVLIFGSVTYAQLEAIDRLLKMNTVFVHILQYEYQDAVIGVSGKKIVFCIF